MKNSRAYLMALIGFMGIFLFVSSPSFDAQVLAANIQRVTTPVSVVVFVSRLNSMVGAGCFVTHRLLIVRRVNLR